MAKNKPTTIRLSDHTLALLETIKQRYNLTTTIAAIETAAQLAVTLTDKAHSTRS